MNTVNQHKALTAWTNRFYFANCCIIWLVGWRYLWTIAPLNLTTATVANELKVWSFLLITYFSHLALLTLVPYLLIIFPLIWLRVKPKWIIGLSLLISILTALVFFIDSLVFAQFHFHLQGIFLEFIFSRQFHQIFTFSSREWLEFSIVAIGLFILQILIALYIWRQLALQQNVSSSNRLPKWFFKTLFISLIFSYLIFLLGATDSKLSLTPQTRALPLFDTLLATWLPIPNSLARIENLGAGNFAQPSAPMRKIHYPLQALHYQTTNPQYNIIFIVIDTWRFNSLTEATMPYTTAFARQSWNFTQHFSGGNATLPGIYSLFYSIPANYHASTQKANLSPVFFETLKRFNYATGIFASADLHQPPLAQAVFNQLPLNTSINGKTPFIRDQQVTTEFLKFLKQQTSKQPYFAFLFYDGAHAFCDSATPNIPFKPMISACEHLSLAQENNPLPYLNRYWNALNTVDQQVNQVLTTLKNAHQLDNTIIVITGDHGEEFNDSQHGYWEHASNFSPYQLQTPFILYWPNKSPKTITYQTTHYDIVPTLLNHVFACNNPASDYSVGHDLFQPSKSSFFIANSYIDYGVVLPNQILTIYPTGSYSLTDWNMNPQSHSDFKRTILFDSAKQLSRFLN